MKKKIINFFVLSIFSLYFSQPSNAMNQEWEAKEHIKTRPQLQAQYKKHVKDLDMLKRVSVLENVSMVLRGTASILSLAVLKENFANNKIFKYSIISVPVILAMDGLLQQYILKCNSSSQNLTAFIEKCVEEYPQKAKFANNEYRLHQLFTAAFTETTEKNSE